MANKDNKNEYEYPDDGPLVPLDLDSEKYEKDDPLVPLPENVCPKCGKKYPFLEKYCSECGTALVAEGKLGEYRKKEEQRKQYEAEQRRRAEEERRRQTQKIEILEEENRRLKEEKEENKKGSGGGMKTLIFAAIIAAAAGIIYVNQKKAVPDNPYVPPISVAENSGSDKNRIAQLEKEKAEEARKRQAAEKKAEEEAAARQAAEAEAERIKQEKEAEEAEKKRKEAAAKRAERIAAQKEKAEEARQRQEAAKASAEAAKQAKNYKVGDIITFGSYPFYADGREKAIDWKILDIDADNNALVISDYALDNVRYNEEDESVTWENSSIRKWLNNDFLNKAFSPEQRGKIIESRIDNNDNARYNTRGGNATTDKLFLLSIEEANKYFNSGESRKAYPTPYAKSNKSVNGNLYVSSSYVSTDRGGSCWWWLRSPGLDQYVAAFVDDGGGVLSFGGRVAYVSVAVRVALKINLNNF